MAERPPIVMVIPDSYRGDVLGHLGNKGAVTPHLDRLAEEAVSYANAFAQNPVCTPSRCSFMTGWYPHVHGHRSMRNLLKPHEPHLLKVLREHGYYVWWGGKNDLVALEEAGDIYAHCDYRHLAQPRSLPLKRVKVPEPNSPLQRVFYGGEWAPSEEPFEVRDADSQYVEGAAAYIREWDGEAPFCVFLPLSMPHPAYVAETVLREKIDVETLPPRRPASELRGRMPEAMQKLREAYGSEAVSEEEWQEIRASYYAMCSKVDSYLGELVAALKARGIYDETMLMFFSDHGDYMGNYDLPEKAHMLLHHDLVRVPLMIKPPAGTPCQPGVRQQLAELLDVTATLYDLLDIEPGYAYQGRSLRASLAGDDGEVHDAVFAETGSRADEASFVNKQVYGLPPESFYARQSTAAIEAHKQGSYAVMCRTRDFKYIRRGYSDEHELYDLQEDPGEMHNRSGDPAYAEVEQKLQLRMLDFWLRTGDVLPEKADNRDLKPVE